MSDPIESLLEAAANPKLTAGPWRSSEKTTFGDEKIGFADVVGPKGGRYRGVEFRCGGTNEDAAFIAAARNGVRAMVEEWLRYGRCKAECENPPMGHFSATAPSPVKFCVCGWDARRSQLEAYLEKTK